MPLLGQERDFAAGATSRPRTGKPTGVPSFPAKTARSTPKSASSSPAPQRNFAPRSGLKGRPRAVDLTRAGRPEASRRRDPQRPQSQCAADSPQGTSMSRDIFRPGSGQEDKVEGTSPDLSILDSIYFDLVGGPINFTLIHQLKVTQVRTPS